MESVQQNTDQDRASSTLLPEMIKTAAHLALLVGVVGLLVALTDVAPWMFTASVSALLAAPVLYGLADIVLSLRALCRRA
ncbi:hypothetical protein [Stenotrophomonas sp. 24(2023)]|uniref:hypothetical protein n=1 Tax=Stenotrophomonas sp. 24(2023) TaxID=3068324 RepID=UPI0027DEACE8|nr:hypothetical protein [Stenotrophomonas sp. 24(2023)]WMJ68636.1 hypothetical protein Q9R17_15805 [Stenotrophomonas sp. 24(2023)]